MHLHNANFDCKVEKYSPWLGVGGIGGWRLLGGVVAVGVVAAGRFPALTSASSHVRTIAWPTSSVAIAISDFSFLLFSLQSLQVLVPIGKDFCKLFLGQSRRQLDTRSRGAEQIEMELISTSAVVQPSHLENRITRRCQLQYLFSPKMDGFKPRCNNTRTLKGLNEQLKFVSYVRQVRTKAVDEWKFVEYWTHFLLISL